MLTATITNNLTVSIGAGTEYHLPAPFDWMTIAGSGTGSALVKSHDLQKIINQTTGFSAADVLQDMVQKGWISVAYAPATHSDVDGVAVGTEAP